MLNIFDSFLNKTTMYRLLLYYLLALVVGSLALSVAGVLPYSVTAIGLSLGMLLVTSIITNRIFARTFEAVPNVESVYLTALILFLIITPSTDIFNLAFLCWAAILATASKYILAYHKKHFFNPAAIAVVITALVLNQSASWWVGMYSMLPIVIIGGVLMVRKIHRSELVLSFLTVAIIAALFGSITSGTNLATAARQLLIDSPLFFFAFVMLTEPLTTPPTKNMQIIYGALTGLLFAPQTHIGSQYTTPELALVGGNIFSWLVSPKMKSLLTLQKIEKVAKDTFDFIFTADSALSFTPGQFLEWTLPVEHADDRGNRRWFTIASSPTEKNIRMGVKFYPEPSRFKQVLSQMKLGQTIMAGSLAGNFVLSKNKNEKSVFIAGGIGVTPFRSIAKYLIDTNTKRDIVLLYSNKTVEEIAYADVFEAAKNIGLKTVYAVTEANSLPAGWPGHIGLIDAELIKRSVPDYKVRRFYISGPHGMVTTFEQLLAKIGVPKNQIITDYFPGFA